MQDALADLIEVEGVRSAFLSGPDGLVVATAGESPESADLRAALLAAVFASIDRGIANLGVGRPLQASIETASHVLHVANLGAYLLVVVADRQSSVGIIRWEMRRAARVVARASA